MVPPVTVVVGCWRNSTLPTGATALAVKLIGLPSAPGTSATTAFAPGVELSVQLPSAAMPSKPVVTTSVVAAGPAGTVMLPPALTRNVTGTPATGAESSAVIGGMCSGSAGWPRFISCTDGATPTAVPTGAVCGSAELLVRVPGIPHVK